MTSERIAYLAGRDAAKHALVTMHDAAINAGQMSFRAIYYLGASDELMNRHPELAMRSGERMIEDARDTQ